MRAVNVQEIQQLITPVIEGAGYELAELEFRRDQGSWVLRLYIDRLPAVAGGAEGQGIGLEDCTKVSREVSATLDVHDVIHTEYTLEVSSPGLDRPLRTADHFRRYQGRLAKVALKRGLDGRRNFTGTILEVSVDGQTVSLETEDKKRFALPLSDLDRANLKF